MKRREILKLGVTACAATTPIGMAVVGGLRQSFPRRVLHVRFIHSETVFKFGGAVNKSHGKNNEEWMREVIESMHKGPFVKLGSR